MGTDQSLVSKAFQTFMNEAPQHAQTWGGMVQGLAKASALDAKTAALAYLAVLAALRMESGVPFHVQVAKRAGATRAEVISAVLDRLGSRLDGRPVEVEAPSVLLPMDFVLMVQVLLNLLENALKYSSPGTPIGVQAKVIGSTLEIAVLDRGYGVPAEDLERIFDKFYRVQRPQGISGTGLGLAICQGIVEAHHGRIRAENLPEGGACITVWLPLSQPPEEGP